MAHVGILFCLYDHLKQLKEENIMAYICLLYTSDAADE